MIVKSTRKNRCRITDGVAEQGDRVINFTVNKCIMNIAILLPDCNIFICGLHECTWLHELVELYDGHAVVIRKDITCSKLLPQVYKLLHDIGGEVVFTVAVRKTVIH